MQSQYKLFIKFFLTFYKVQKNFSKKDNWNLLKQIKHFKNSKITFKVYDI